MKIKNIRPKIENREKHQGKHGKYSKNLGKQYNPGHNILELYDILVKIRFTSKTKLDI